MRRSLISSAAALALTLALPADAGAIPLHINVRDDFFRPRNPLPREFQPGQSFRWETEGMTIRRHNIRQDDRLFSSGGLAVAINFSINASAGSYHYYCTLHRATGMSGRVKVRPVAGEAERGKIDVRWADSNTNTGSRFDVRYRVDRRRWKTWKNDTSRFHAFFGRRDKPVNYNPNRHNYRVKVRSERRRVSKRSDWSPAVLLEAFVNR